MRESADKVTGDFLDLKLAEQLLVLRRVVPAVFERLDREELVGFARDLLSEVASNDRHGRVEGERPMKRPPRWHARASEEKTHKFLRQVAQEAGLGGADEAASPVSAVLCAVQQRITGREAHQLLAELPQGIQALASCPAIHEERATGDSSLGRGRFLASVAEHVGLEDEEEAERIARCVLHVLQSWISEGEIHDVMSQLPADLKPLFTQA